MSPKTSKNYCHLVLNNDIFINQLKEWKYQVGDKIITENLINRYILAFQYAISYAWIIFYTEECIKKTYITEDDRFVFTLDQIN